MSQRNYSGQKKEARIQKKSKMIVTIQIFLKKYLMLERMEKAIMIILRKNVNLLQLKERLRKIIILVQKAHTKIEARIRKGKHKIKIFLTHRNKSLKLKKRKITISQRMVKGVVIGVELMLILKITQHLLANMDSKREIL